MFTDVPLVEQVKCLALRMKAFGDECVNSVAGMTPFEIDYYQDSIEY